MGVLHAVTVGTIKGITIGDRLYYRHACGTLSEDFAVYGDSHYGF